MTASPPPGPAMAWALDTAGLPAETAARPMPGGHGGQVWLLQGPDPATAVVLKLAAPASAGGDERLIRREAVILEALAPLAMPVPEVLATDASGSQAGTPALLMKRAPGELLSGQDAVREAIPAMAEVLILCQRRTHNLVAGRRWTPWQPASGFRVPSWSTREALWNRAIRVVQGFQAPRCDAFIHRDPHPANMLFENGAVSAVLDWPHAGRGPAGFDGARMAMNLCCLLGMDAATAFRGAFETALGHCQDPLLEVYAACEFLPDPQLEATAGALGIELSRNQARGRLENFLADAMRRMTSRRLS
ncbi:MAG: aminoglycoside phosphotransferase family protein [Gammaproteobacteria bacterium]|nr:aminoglycoside phosphotransferase family protein [Gammaproteobacteria bacterium]